MKKAFFTLLGCAAGFCAQAQTGGTILLNNDTNSLVWNAVTGTVVKSNPTFATEPVFLRKWLICRLRILEVFTTA
jgi:hypothetical protein